MAIEFTPSTKESEEARILKLKEDAVEAGIKAKEILNSIGIKYIIRLYNEGGCIKFYKGSKCIMMAGLLTGTNELTANFSLYYNATKLKDRKRFKTVEENDFLTDILLILYSQLQ